MSLSWAALVRRKFEVDAPCVALECGPFRPSDREQVEWRIVTPTPIVIEGKAY